MPKEYIERRSARKQLQKEAEIAEYKGVIHHVVPVCAIDKIPAADVVEVVRCKDCKYFQNYGRTSLLVNNKNMKAGWCQRRIKHDEEYRVLKYDFCSYGERRGNTEKRF